MKSHYYTCVNPGLSKNSYNHNSRSTLNVIVLYTFALISILFGLTGTGLAAKATPSISLSTTAINFGAVSIGQTATQAVVLKSTGTAPVAISGISVAGSLFGATGITTPLTLNPGQSVTLTATFRPAVANPWNYTGIITISSNSASSPRAAINMSGQGVVSLRSISCANSSIAGAGTDACTVTLSGGAPTGGQVVTLASNNASVAVPASVTVPSAAASASFSATVSTVSSAQTATITANSGGISQSFPLQLTGVPSLSLSTTSIDFGNVTIGQTATHAVVLQSTGSAPVTISGISVSGSLFGGTGIATPLTLNPGQSATLTATFRPTVANPWNYTGIITIASNSSAGNLTLNMTGAGISPALSALNCANGSITGAATDACTVSLNAPAPAGGVPVSLSSSSSSVAVPTSVVIAAGSTSAAFSASVAAVSSSQTATITATAGSLTKTFALQLAAATPSLTVSSTSVNFGTVAVGKVATQTVILTSSGNAPVTISGLSVAGSLFSASGITTPITLNPGQTASLALSFTSINGGPFTGILTVANNSSAGSLTVNMSGAEVGVLTSVTCASSSMSSAGTDSCSVNLNGQAPAGGFAVALTSSNSSVTVPSTVTVAQYSTSASFSATVAAVSSSQTATITASASGASASLSLALTPSAAGTLSVNATSVPFGEVYVGQSATQSLTLTASNGSVTVNSAVITGAVFAESGLTLPLTITSGQSATLDLEFAPTASGSATGQLTIQSNASNATVNLPLSGVGENHSVQLNWTAPGDSSIVGYNVYRAASGTSSYSKINSSVNPSTTYTDTICHDGQAYLYYVTSVDSEGRESVPSNSITVSVPN